MKNIEYLIEILSKKLAETSKNNEKVQNENKKIEEVLNDLECTYDSIKKYTSDVELRKILEKCSPTDKKYSTDFKILEIFLKGIESGKLSTIDSNVEQIIARIKINATINTKNAIITLFFIFFSYHLYIFAIQIGVHPLLSKISRYCAIVSLCLNGSDT